MQQGLEQMLPSRSGSKIGEVYLKFYSPKVAYASIIPLIWF
jgi:hypothetical protein